jgi:P27 family predicted phage terminase small subunit
VPGPRPKPVEVKQGMGNPGKRSMKTAPARVSGIPDMPSSFKGDAKAYWTWVTDLLLKRGQLTQDSTPSLVALCQVFSEREKLWKHLQKKGHFQTITTTAGDRVEKLRPAVPAFADADRRYRAWLAEFGLTDASRGKVHTDPAKAPGPIRGGGEPEAGENPAARYGLK